MKKAIPFLILLLLVYGCGKDDPKPDDNHEIPVAVTLVFPYENSLCNEGTDVTDTVSTVHFEWETADYTDEYELNVKNLTTGATSTHQTSGTEYSLVLNRATPFAWFVVSKSISVVDTAQSATWKFYNAGEVLESYAPFPAEIISPGMAVTISAPTGLVTLDWNGSDVDGDIVGYDVYFGTTTPPGISESDLTESVLNDVSVSAGTIYFWRVVTTDSHGNKSNSGIYQFKIL
jgi:hypothetical protein